MNTLLKPNARRLFAAVRYQAVAGKLLVGLILTFLAAGSATSASAANVSYRCSDGTALRAVFRGLGQTGSAKLSFAGQGRPITLPQAPSADGGRYAGGDTEFWIKGTTARLTRQGVVIECEKASR